MNAPAKNIKRMWLLTTEYPPFYGGGIGTYCYLTAKMLAEHGIAVTVFINDATINHYKIQEAKGIRIIRFNTSRTHSSSFLGHTTNVSYEFAAIVKEFVENEGTPDLIEAQEYLGIAYYLLQFKFLQYSWCKNIPVQITIHSPSFLYMEYNHVSMYRYPNYWICEMEKFCLQAADHLIAPSKFMLDELNKRFKLTNPHVSIIPNPFDPVYMKTKGLDQLGDGNQIVFFGKLTAQKGAFKLLQYFDELWKSGFDQTLFLLGGQDIVYHPEEKTMGDIIRKRYKQYIKEGLLQLEDKIPPHQIAERLSKAALVIIPSANDNLPYTVFEMMSLGKIVLASKQGGQSEVIADGLNGFIFDHEKKGSFKKTLYRILSLQDKDRKTISENAQLKVAGNYNLHITYERRRKVIEEILNIKNGNARYFPSVRTFVKEDKVLHVPAENRLLSVVVPYYNMAAYIDDTIASIQNSDYEQIEIIIVNDGSDDQESIEKLQLLEKQTNIHIIHIENGGLGNARNVGAVTAKGVYLAFLDADDKVAKDYYSKAIRVLSNYQNVGFVGCWTQYFGNSQNTWPAFSPEPPVILFHNTVNTSALVYHRHIFLQCGMNDARMPFQGLEDYDSVISMIGKGYVGAVLPETLFYYRVRRNSMIRSVSRQKKQILYQYITDKHCTQYATFVTEIINLVNANGNGMELDNPSLDYHLADRLPFGSKASAKIISIIKKNKHAKKAAYQIYRLIKLL